MDKKDDIIRTLQEQVKVLTAKVGELKPRLGLNSDNSSKPPSSDGLRKKSRSQSLRKTGDKKSGGQPGHKGSTLKQVTDPDHFEWYQVDQCSKCNLDLSCSPVTGLQRRQVFDIPEPPIEVTEHQAEIKICSCGQRCVANFPPGISAPTQYGQRVKTLCVYLNYQQLIPEDRVSEFFSDLFSLGIASATVVATGERFATSLSSWKQETEDCLAAKNLDQTGLRVQGKNQWLHVMSNEAATVDRVSPKRGETR